MRIDNQQQQNKGVMDLMPQTGGKRGYLSESGKRREKDGHR